MRLLTDLHQVMGGTSDTDTTRYQGGLDEDIASAFGATAGTMVCTGITKRPFLCSTLVGPVAGSYSKDFYVNKLKPGFDYYHHKLHSYMDLYAG